MGLALFFQRGVASTPNNRSLRNPRERQTRNLKNTPKPYEMSHSG